ncbi:hypothetical protein CBM2599_B60001 [Cupriavidus taiwanensis]|nr:hypothetical protein CBM2600_B80001 [Cupriavidus taiwanensis]SOZ06631.1 hypothetical protein CBM2599_B60001 [Cupriavidus taiwanensis]
MPGPIRQRLIQVKSVAMSAT